MSETLNHTSSAEIHALPPEAEVFTKLENVQTLEEALQLIVTYQPDDSEWWTNLVINHGIDAVKMAARDQLFFVHNHRSSNH